MNHNEENLSSIGRSLLNRRRFMKNLSFFAWKNWPCPVARQRRASRPDDPTSFTGKKPIRPDIDPDNPYAPRDAHFKGAAKQVLTIFCPGAVSRVDTFDYKPELIKYHDENHLEFLR